MSSTGSGSSSTRHTDSLLPVLALGLAAAGEWLVGAVARRPALASLALARAAGAMNVALLEGVRAEAGARRVTKAVGSPPTWPASWVFAWRHRLPLEQYDLLVGRYLFYRQNNLQGRIDLGAPGDEAMLGEGWGARAVVEGVAPVRTPRWWCGWR